MPNGVVTDTPNHSTRYDQSGDSTSHVITFGWTPAVGSLLVLVVASTQIANVPSGYIGTRGSSGGKNAGLFYKIADGTETSATVTFSVSAGVIIWAFEYTGSRWRNVALNAAAGGTSSTSISIISANPALAVAIAACGGPANSYTGGWTSGWYQQGTSFSLSGTYIVGGVGTHVSSSTPDTTLATMDTSDGSNASAYAAGSFTKDNTIPTPVYDFRWPSDGIGNLGPFVSSTGNVYVLGSDASDGTKVLFWKSTDPTDSFTKQTNWNPFSANIASLSAHQVGDTIHVFAASSTAYSYRTWSMSSDSWTASAVSIVTSLTPINLGVGGAARTTGSDVIVFYNTTGVVSMGKTYGRIAARRIAGGTAAGAITAIGLAVAATTAQTESVDSVLLGSSNRIHLFWTKTSASAGAASTILGRCVKSTDNLDGTVPATAAYNVSTNAVANSAPENSVHGSGQAFLSSGSVIAVPLCKNSTNILTLGTATDADTPTWTLTDAGSAAMLVNGPGNMSLHACIGGAPYNGTNKTISWIDNSSQDPFYDKDTGSGFGTDQTIEATSATEISSNVFTRDGDVVLATIYDRPTGIWYYNETVLVAGAKTRSISPVTITLTPVALSRSTDTVSTSISPVSLTLTPVALTATADTPLTGSIMPVTITLTPVALVRSTDNVSTPLSPVIMTLTPVALVRSTDDVSTALSPAIMTLTPIALSTSVGDAPSALSPALMTLTPVALSRSTDDVSIGISPVELSLIPVEFSRSTDDVSTILTPVEFLLNLVALSTSVGDAPTTIDPAEIFFNPVALVRGDDTVFSTIDPAEITLVPVSLTRGIDDVSYTLDPVILTLDPVMLIPILGGKPYVWEGSEWVLCVLKVWTGSEWVEKPLKVWTGSSWELA